MKCLGATEPQGGTAGHKHTDLEGEARTRLPAYFSNDKGLKCVL
jgi:hypothetical protein